FAIMKDGGIEGLLLSEKSGYVPLDSSVISAVKDSAPLPPLPKEFGESFRQVNVRFELKR
ncbi:MAG: energy transducer TonB, partial [Candidatus Aureabacteria bacterium]|nr:energy transducer TonB [Candidatus Auribacterota bacterium]